MNVTSKSSIATPSGLNSDSGVRNLFRTIRAELRRGLELTVEAYGKGFAPPM